MKRRDVLPLAVLPQVVWMCQAGVSAALVWLTSVKVALVAALTVGAVATVVKDGRVVVRDGRRVAA